MSLPDHLRPFVLPVETVTPDRRGSVDVYLPSAAEPRPAVVFVHGGLVPAQLRPTPRDWPVYRGYGSLAAARGVVGVTVDHRLHQPTAYPEAAADIVEAVRGARELPQVDADRVAVWFFSGGGLLLADWLRTPPAWLRCVAATYPLLAPLPGWHVDPAFRPVQAITETAAGTGTPPIVLTRAGLESPEVAEVVEEFVAAAGNIRLEVIDVPNGRHGFDMLDHTEESRKAVELAFDLVLAHLSQSRP
jgi:acetyl esterase/lipase